MYVIYFQRFFVRLFVSYLLSAIYLNINGHLENFCKHGGWTVAMNKICDYVTGVSDQSGSEGDVICL